MGNFCMDKLNEECGVFGIYAHSGNVAETIFYGLQAPGPGAAAHDENDRPPVFPGRTALRR